MNDDKIKSIRQHGKLAQGQRDLINYLQGKRLTMQQAIHAKCYECMGYFADGKLDCRMPKCPLHKFMPYNAEKQKRTTPQK